MDGHSRLGLWCAIQAQAFGRNLPPHARVDIERSHFLFAHHTRAVLCFHTQIVTLEISHRRVQQALDLSAMN